MEDRKGTVWILLGWTALIQALTVLVAVGMVFLTFDPWGGDGGMVVFGMVFLLAWAVWGYLLPRRVRVSNIQVIAVLGLWSVLFLAIWFCLEDQMILFNFPQMLTGMWLAQLWPGSHYNAWYQWTLEPIMVRAAHFLLPAMMGLGLWLRKREEGSRNGGERE